MDQDVPVLVALREVQVVPRDAIIDRTSGAMDFGGWGSVDEGRYLSQEGEVFFVERIDGEWISAGQARVVTAP